MWKLSLEAILYQQKPHFCYHSFFRKCNHIYLWITVFWELKRHLPFPRAKCHHCLYWGSKRFTFKTNFIIKTYFLHILFEKSLSMCQNKRAFIYLLSLFALVLAHFPNCTVFPSCAFKEKLQFLVFGYKLEPPREKKKMCSGFSINEDLW